MSETAPYRWPSHPNWRVHSPGEGGLGPYYVVEPLSALLEKFPLDDGGVPVVDWNRLGFRGVDGKSRFIQATAQVALAAHAEAKIETQDAPLNGCRAGELFLNLARLVLDEAQTGPADGLVWPARHALPRYGLPSGWISGMTQGLVMSVVARAYEETSCNDYARALRLASKVLNRTVCEGGVKVEVGDDAVFFEEAPAPRDYHILNHTIFALFGLYDAHRTLGDANCAGLLQAGVRGVRAMLPKHDTGYWSLYETGGRATVGNHFRLASPAYHTLHVAQLEALYLLTGEADFHEYASRWAGYATGAFAWAMKLAYRIFRWATWKLKRAG